MIVVRTVMQGKFGQGGRLAAGFIESNRKMMDEMSKVMGGPRRWRVLTDLSGPFDNVVMEVEVESLAEWEKARAALFSLPTFQESMRATSELVEGGGSEFWTVEAEG
jgi:hypothetical protein